MINTKMQPNQPEGQFWISNVIYQSFFLSVKEAGSWCGTPPVQTHFHLSILQVSPVRQVQWQPWLNDASVRNTRASTNAPPSLLGPLRWLAGSFHSETPLFLKELSHCLIQVTGEAKSFICLQHCLSVSDGNHRGTTSPSDFFSKLFCIFSGTASLPFVLP